MNKTIKEQSEAYCKEWAGGKLEFFVERIITEERKRRLPTKQEFRNKLYSLPDYESAYDWLLSYESDHIPDIGKKVEDEVKVEPTSKTPHAIASDVDLALRMVGLNGVTEKVGWLLYQAVNIYQKKRGDFSLDEATKIQFVADEIFGKDEVDEKPNPTVEDEVKVIHTNDCIHQYSTAIQQLYPRLCLKCGKAEDEEKVGSKVDIQAMETKSWRNELAEKIMLRNSNVFFEIEDYRCDDLVHGCFQLADEFIKQAKGQG